MTLIENIEKITTWYKSLKRDFAGVSDLMYARQQLAGLLADFAVQTASLVEQRKRLRVSAQGGTRRNPAPRNGERRD